MSSAPNKTKIVFFGVQRTAKKKEIFEQSNFFPKLNFHFLKKNGFCDS